MTRKESGEGCFTVFLENRNVNYFGSKKKKKKNLPDERVVHRGFEVRRGIRIDWEGGCFSSFACETQA